MDKFKDIKPGDTVMVLITERARDRDGHFYIPASVNRVTEDRFYVLYKNSEIGYRKRDGALLRPGKMPLTIERAALEHEVRDGTEDLAYFVKQRGLFENLLTLIYELGEVEEGLNSRIPRQILEEANSSLKKLVEYGRNNRERKTN